MTAIVRLTLIVLLVGFATPAWLLAAPGDGDRRPEPRLSAEEVEEAFELLERVSPELVESLRQRHAKDPAGVEQALLRRFPKFQHFQRMKRWDPQMYDLRVEEMRLSHQTQQLAGQYRKAAQEGSDASARELRRELGDRVTELVAARDAIRQHELQRLEARLARLQAEMEERAAQREEIVAKEIEELIAVPDRPEDQKKAPAKEPEKPERRDETRKDSKEEAKGEKP